MHPSTHAATGRLPRRSPITKPGYRKGLKPPNAGKTYPAEVLDPHQVLAVLGRCPLQGPHRRTGVRNRALFTILWRSGLRIEEALCLEPKDVDLRRGTIAVLRGKGGHRRTVPVDRAALSFLVEWMELRAELLDERGDPALAGLDYGPLFCVVTRPSVGRRMHSSTVREALKLRAGQAGVHRRVHPHGLRHTFASEVYFHEGARVADVQLALGHRPPAPPTATSTRSRAAAGCSSSCRTAPGPVTMPSPDRIGGVGTRHSHPGGRGGACAARGRDGPRDRGWCGASGGTPGRAGRRSAPARRSWCRRCGVECLGRAPGGCRRPEARDLERRPPVGRGVLELVEDELGAGAECPVAESGVAIGAAERPAELTPAAGVHPNVH